MSQKSDTVKDIISSLEFIDDEFIAEYDTFEAKSTKKNYSRTEFIKCFSAIAACLIIVISLTVSTLHSYFANNPKGPCLSDGSKDCEAVISSQPEENSPGNNIDNIYVQDVLQNAYYIEVNSVSDSVAWLAGILSDRKVMINNNLHYLSVSDTGFGSTLRPDTEKSEHMSLIAPSNPGEDPSANETAASTTKAPETMDTTNGTNADSLYSSTNQMIRDSLNSSIIPNVVFCDSIQPTNVQMGLSANINIKDPDLIPYIRYGFDLDNLDCFSPIDGDSKGISVELGVSFRFLNDYQNTAYSKGISDGRKALGYSDTSCNSSVVFEGKKSDAYYSYYSGNDRCMGYITFYSPKYKCEVEISIDICGRSLPAYNIQKYFEELAKQLKLTPGGI